MRTSTITTPVDRKIDEWVFRVGQTSVKYTVNIRRSRDPEECDKPDQLATFFAVFDRDYWEKKNPGKAISVPVARIERSGYNELYSYVRYVVYLARDSGWVKSIIVYAGGTEAHESGSRPKFGWRVCYRSIDGKLFREADLSPDVYTSPSQILRCFDSNTSISVYDYTRERESMLRDMDAKMEEFAYTLRKCVEGKVSYADVGNAIGKLIPLTTGQVSTSVIESPEVRIVDGFRM